MKRLAVLTLVAALCLLSACGQGASAPDTSVPVGEEAPASEAAEAAEGISVFPKSEDCFVGDTMPYYEDGTMNIFYLADQRDGKTGYHPWALMRTQDYCNYEDMGVVIPYGETTKDQDIALGTGCVIKDQQGLYHAFYTGHNDHFAPKEAIMHATSSDMLNWTKIPEDTFLAGDNYSQDDFRDPYVFYVEEDQCYWMLVVTRSKDTGVIVRYTSTDLSKWKDEGIFFEDDMGYGTNMECPSLLKYKDKWYLAFSDQWPDRVVHYRVSESVKGPFQRLEKDTVGGNGFYAGRLETDGEKLYVVGWNGTKVGHQDENNYDWAGNAVIHQLEQNPDGSLKPVVNERVKEALSHELPLSPVAMTETVESLENGYQFSGKDYELVQFDTFDNAARVEADITGFDGEGLFGVSFAPDIENVGALNYVFNPKENQIQFYNTPELFDADPESYMDFDFSKTDTIHMTLLLSDGVASVYVNDELALSARVYRSQGTNWEFYAAKSGVRLENVHIYS